MYARTYAHTREGQESSYTSYTKAIISLVYRQIGDVG